MQFSAEVGGNHLQAEAGRPTCAERLEHGHGGVEEVRLRSHQVEAESLRHQRAQRQRRLERGDSSTGDDHARRFGAMVEVETGLGRGWDCGQPST